MLRVWEDQIAPDGQWIQVLRHSDRVRGPGRVRFGQSERIDHVERIRAGTRAYGVVCRATDPDAPGARKIASYDAAELVELGEVRPIGDADFARIVRRVPVSETLRPAAAADTLVEDLTELLSRAAPAPATTRQALVDARVGQGRFRAEVLAGWDGRCAVTGCDAVEVLRASHLKPWRESSDTERLDPDNGLPLVATLDAPRRGPLDLHGGRRRPALQPLGAGARAALQLDTPPRLRRPPSAAMQGYLQWHQAKVFRR